MLEEYYHSEALAFITDLVNNPLTGPDDLTARWCSFGLAVDGGPAATAADVKDIADFVAQWERVIDAESEDQRVTLLNSLLAGEATYPRITNHDGSRWHLHYRDDGVGLADIVRAVTVVAGAQHLTRLGMHRLARCTLTECTHAFVDVTRGGVQRYCSRVCANRDAVRRFRAKKTR